MKLSPRKTPEHGDFHRARKAGALSTNPSMGSWLWVPAFAWATVGEAPRTLSASRSRIHVAAVDGDRLPGDEIALGRGEEDERAKEILRMLVAMKRARLDGALTRGRHMAGIFGNDGIAEGEAGRERVDADAELAELA